jgi:hypothetical protein
LLSVVLRTTVALPLSAWITVRSVLVRRDHRALLLTPDKLSLGLLDAFKIRTVFGLCFSASRSSRGLTD